MSAVDRVVPDARARRRSRLFWIAMALILVLAGVAGVLFARAVGDQPRPLDPDSYAPVGTRAIATVLEERGVSVEVVRNHTRLSELLVQGTEPTTVLLTDNPALSDDAYLEFFTAGDDVVLADPRSRLLALAFDDPGAATSFAASTAPLPAACDFPAARAATAITPATLFQVDGAPGLVRCFPGLEGSAFGLVASNDGDRTLSAIDGRSVLSNDTIATAGNAALALALLGGNDRLLWYLPDPDDTDLPVTDPTLGQLAPDWLPAMIGLAMVTAIAVGAWRGRRFGPLVFESLPVTARVSETRVGRAQLYRAGRDFDHAVATLRTGTLTRLRRLLGIPADADASVVADAAASATGLPQAQVRHALVTAAARGDRDALELAEQLQMIERAVASAVRDGRNDS